MPATGRQGDKISVFQNGYCSNDAILCSYTMQSKIVLLFQRNLLP